MSFISPGSDGPPGIHRELEVQAGDVVRFTFDPEIPLQYPFSEYTMNGYELSYRQGSGCSELSLNARAGLEPDEADPGPAVGVTASMEEAAPGDSIEIDLHLLFGNGTTRDFPAWQRFDAEITVGQELGVLVADGGAQTGTSLSQVPGEIEFIAHDDDDAFGTVEITVTTLLEADVDLIIGSLPEGAELMQGGVQQQGIYLEGKVEINVGEEEIRVQILDPTSESDDIYISSAPEMPEVSVEAQLLNYTGGEVQFHWEYEIEYSFSRFGVRSDRSRYDLCDRHGIATFTGTSASQNSEISSWQIPFERENAEFSYVGMTRDCSDFRNSWDGTGDVLIGGQTTVTVTAETADGRTFTDTVLANKILGSNPPVSEVKSGLSLKEQVVAYKETWHTARWKHFNIADRDLQYNRIGMPAYGFPNGFGLFQIDNPPSNEERLWNWRSNRQAGGNLLEQKRIDAEGWPRRIRRRANDPRKIGFQNTPDFETEQQLWKETFQRYNGGAYWEWRPDDEMDPNSDGVWHVNELASGYGKEVWDLYENVKNGNFPVNWE